MGAMKELWMTQVIEGRAQGLCTCEMFDEVYDPECAMCSRKALIKEAATKEHTEYVQALFDALARAERARDCLSETSKTRKRIDEVIYILVDMLEGSGALDE